MNRKRISLIIPLCFCAQLVFAQLNTKADDQTLKWLKQFRADYIKSKSGKAEQVQSYYDNAVRLMPEFQKTIIGKENVLIYEKAFSNRFDVSSYDRTESEIIDLGTRVIETGSFTQAITLKQTKQSAEIKGKYLDLWIRENGKLSLVTQAWNYNHSLEWEDKLKFNEVPYVDVALQAHVPINNAISFELAALNRLMERTVSEHDNQVWLQFYADDGQFLYSRHEPVTGKKEINLFLEEHVKGLPVFEKLDVRNDRIDDLGQYVVEYASHIAIIRHGDFSGVFTGKDLAIWRREPNGSLKIFRHIGMYD